MMNKSNIDRDAESLEKNDGDNPFTQPLLDSSQRQKRTQRDKVIVLIVNANPNKTKHLRLDREIEAIREELEVKALNRARFQVEVRPALRVDKLQQLLREVEPDILHFGGHGAQSGILVENKSGEIHAISIEALEQTLLLHKKYLQCVVLNACYSESQAVAIAKHINCVVGMSSAIRDDAAITFAREFYKAIGAGESVAHAFDAGRLQIKLENLRDEDKPRLKAALDAYLLRFGVSSQTDTQLTTSDSDKMMMNDGDTIIVGAITGSTGVAIGRGASAQVTTYGKKKNPDSMLDIHPLRSHVRNHAQSSDIDQLLQKVAEMHTEMALRDSANDGTLSILMQDIVDSVPSAVSPMLDLFAQPDARRCIGRITKSVLGRWQKRF